MGNDMQSLSFNVPGMTGAFTVADAEARAQLKNKLDATALPEAVNTALAQAKASGEFDGAPGDPGYTPVKGKDYWTEEDVAAINAEAQTYIDEQLADLDISGGGSGSMQVVTTTGSGSSYSATVPGIDALTRGAHFIMIPHANSNKTAPKLNVNGLGEKTLRMQKPVNTAMSATPSNVDWLRGNYPVLVIYDGSYWVVLMPYVDAEAFRGVLTPAKGGLGTKSIDEATALLVTSESVQSALGYTPADAENVVQLQQGSANVGKILVVGADGNLTLTDMPELLSGDVIGTLDANNNIVITGSLSDGTYTFVYDNADGTYADIGSLVIGKADPAYTNLADPSEEAGWLNDKRFSTSNLSTETIKDGTGAVITNYIHINIGQTLRIKGIDCINTAGSIVPVMARYNPKDTFVTLRQLGSLGTYDANTNISEFTFSGSTILDGDYIRVCGALVAGYTADDVIITLDQEITD